MGWEQRNGSSRRYYTRSRRVAGRVRREYIGNGEAAHRAAVADAAKQQQRAEQQRAQQALQAQRNAIYSAIFTPLGILEMVCQIATRRELEAAGYHQHKRGEWRKQRATRRSVNSARSASESISRNVRGRPLVNRPTASAPGAGL